MLWLDLEVVVWRRIFIDSRHEPRVQSQIESPSDRVLVFLKSKDNSIASSWLQRSAMSSIANLIANIYNM